jgi:hypothetical protein
MIDSVPPPDIPAVRTLLRQVRAGLVWSAVGRRLAVAGSVALVVFGTAALADWFCEFPLATRRVILAVNGTVSFLLAAWAAAAVFTQRRDDEGLALLLERCEPDLGGRMIAAVQLAAGHAAIPGPESAPFVAAVAGQAEAAAKTRRFEEAIDLRGTRRALVASAVLLAAGALAFALGGATSLALARRAFLSDTEIPRATRVVSVSGGGVVGIGDDVRIDAAAEGALPGSGSLQLQFEDGRDGSVALDRAGPTSATYSAVVRSVRSGFRFRARLGDGRSGWFAVRALPRPEVESFGAEQGYPPFTGMPPSRHQPGGFLLFPGATLRVTAGFSKPVARAVLELVGTGQSLVMEAAPGGRAGQASASFTVPAAGLTGLMLEATDLDGLSLRESPVYRVAVVEDRPPEVRVIAPAQPVTTLTESAVIPVEFAAADRYGIGAVALVAERNGGTPVREPLSIDSGARELSHRFDWMPRTSFPDLSVGDTLEFRIEAADVNPAVAAGTSRSLTARVVSEDEKRQELLGRAADALGRINDVADDQESLNAELGRILREEAER